MQGVKITELISKDVDIQPDFIYNRFDLYDTGVVLVSIEYQGNTRYVEYSMHGHTAEMGVWLMDITVEEIVALSHYIFDNNDNIDRVSFQNGYHPMGYFKKKNHFRISLPENKEEMEKRLSSKGRYNIKRERRLIEAEVGAVRIVEYRVENIPEDVFKTYFSFKAETHHVDYHMTADEYISRYHVTHVYVLYAGDHIMSIILSCEQCKVIYIENLTYDIHYSKYSAGQVLYDYYLQRLIEKGFKEVFLAGGNLSYKKRYGSVEDTVYHGTIFRHKYVQYYEEARDSLKSKINLLIGRK